MLPEYLDRHADEYRGGLARLRASGLVFANASLGYAMAGTGAGHATISSGLFPRRHGIIANDWVAPETRKKVYCVDDAEAKVVDGEGGGVSPANLVGEGVGDWLKAASPASRVVSIAGKDRAAILMGGRRPDQVWWYAPKTGRMVTSSYYVSWAPAWAKAFNDARWTDAHTPDLWTLLLPESHYAADAPDDFAPEMKLGGSRTFPHALAASAKTSLQLDTPFWDLLLLDFARAAARGEGLGSRETPDLLFVGLSATDYIGHHFGPRSREMHDHLLRLDRALGEFLKDLESRVGRGRVAVVVTADHGVMPVPEYVNEREGGKARRLRFDTSILPRIRELERSLQSEWGIEAPLIEMKAMGIDGFLGFDAAAGAGVEAPVLERRVREGLLKIDGIEDVYLRRELTGEGLPERPYLDEFRRGYYAPRGADFEIRYCEMCLISPVSIATDHYSAYAYDTHVPLIFMGAGILPGRIDEKVFTVRIAPTLARILGVPAPADRDGEPLALAPVPSRPRSRGGK
jgi:hypothetical protein